MPELPEVETIRRIIEPQIAGQTIVSVTVNNPQIIAHPSEAQFIKSLIGQEVVQMSRRGKFLTIGMKSGDGLTIHLRMTGQLLVTPADYPDEKHTHFVADLSAGKQIRYIDVRRFGRFWFLKKDESDGITGRDKLGLEPFSEALTAEYLKSKMGKRKKVIKGMLLDQSVIAGIGNIYADEILNDAGIYPGEQCCDLSAEDWNCLAGKIKEIMAWAIATNKMTPEDYLAGKGKEYSNTPYLRVYGRAGQACRKCQTTIEKAVICGRSSCYCPACQREKSRSDCAGSRVCKTISGIRNAR